MAGGGLTCYGSDLVEYNMTADTDVPVGGVRLRIIPLVDGVRLIAHKGVH
jgi:hypothetical protein